MEEILPVNIAEGGGRKGLHAAGVCDTHAASSCFEDFTGKIFSIHSSRATTMQGVCARRAHAVFAPEDGRVPAQETAQGMGQGKAGDEVHTWASDPCCGLHHFVWC